jgi:SAM-dependent methyltransferase
MVLLTCAAGSRADDLPRTGGPYVPTPQTVVDEMLKFAQVRAEDFVIDLGSGDGRIVLTAARRYGARGLGYDIDEELVAQSNARASELGVAERVRFSVQDVTTAAVDQATVLTLYLLPGMNQILQPRLLRELAPGSRIVSHDFDLGAWKADRQISVDVAEKYGAPGSWKSTIYLWIVPARVEGQWRIILPAPQGESVRLQLRQHFQRLEGVAYRDGRRYAKVAGQLDGTRVRLRLSRSGGSEDAFEGVVEGDRMHGTAAMGGASLPWSGVRELVPASRANAQ